MKAGRLDTHLAGLVKMARQWVESSDADSLLLLLDEPLDWPALAEAASGVPLQTSVQGFAVTEAGMSGGSTSLAQLLGGAGVALPQDSVLFYTWTA